MSNRVLSRVGARELTIEEVARARGGGCGGNHTPTHIPVTSLFPPVVDGMVQDCS